MLPALAAVVLLLVFAPAAAAQAPIEVGGTPITAEELRRAEAELCKNQDAGRGKRLCAAEQLIRLAWVRGEAALRGLGVTEAELDAAVARERRWFTEAGEYGTFEEAMQGTTMEELRARLRDGRLERKVADRVYASVRDDRAYGAAWAALNARWRAQTRCAPAYAAPGVCAGVPTAREELVCEWAGLVDVCLWRVDGDRYWAINDDVSGELGVYNNGDAEAELADRLDGRRGFEFDSEADTLTVYAPFRAALSPVTRLIHRLTLARRTPGPAPGDTLVFDAPDDELP